MDSRFRLLSNNLQVLDRLLSLEEIVGVPIVIVHVSNREAMEEIDRARKRGALVVGETCPQYLMLTAEDLDGDGWEGAKFVCSPPPRDLESQAACWQGLEQGIFDLFSSDHCPFKFDDPEGKLNERGKKHFRWIPNGIGISLEIQYRCLDGTTPRTPPRGSATSPWRRGIR